MGASTSQLAVWSAGRFLSTPRAVWRVIPVSAIGPACERGAMHAFVRKKSSETRRFSHPGSAGGVGRHGAPSGHAATHLEAGVPPAVSLTKDLLNAPASYAWPQLSPN